MYDLSAPGNAKQWYNAYAYIAVVQLLGCVWLFETPWMAAHQVFLSFTISQSLLSLMSIESMMLSNHLILRYPLLLLPSIFSGSGSFPMSQLFTWDGQSIGASASVLPMNLQGWFPLGLIDLISLRSKGLSRVFPSTTVGKHQFFGVTGKTIVDYTDLCQQSDVSAF